MTRARLAAWLFAALAAGSLGAISCGCGRLWFQGEPLGDLSEQCGLVCPDRGLEDLVLNDVGPVPIEHWLASVLAVEEASRELEAEALMELRALARDVGLEAVEEASVSQLGEQIQIALEAEQQAWLTQGPSYALVGGTCEVRIGDLKRALDHCLAQDAFPTTILTCEGECQVPASDRDACEDPDAATCEGTDPTCAGICVGACHLDSAQTCAGICHGQCDGVCDHPRPDGGCDGVCEGSCLGVCEDPAGATCEGLCQGTCQQPAALGGCEDATEAWCAVAGPCTTTCRGTVDIDEPEVACEAAARLRAAIHTGCSSARLVGGFTLSDAIADDEDLSAEVRASMSVRRRRIERLATLLDPAQSRSAALESSLLQSIEDAETTIKGAIEAHLFDDAGLADAIALACLLSDLSDLAGLVVARMDAIENLRLAYADIALVMGVDGF